ncbi:undecaprenyl diphosphate synthase family protein [Streptomyces rishiriensis]|uniref:undecaprenyl diphosphate synthase family protein n=1 Tax=Streptomyces rishiriensis TaxID=68264 RepID=UPI0037CF74D9
MACVMDGNGRWAQRRSLPRTAGHRAAETAVIDVIEAARAAGVEWLSLYAFSTENWNRPGSEVEFLMRLVRRVVRKHAPLLLARGIRCRFLGVTDPRIPRELAQDFDDLATLTADNRGMTLTAVPSLAGPALIRVAEVLFDATDKDGNGSIDTDEYRTLFRTAFHRDLPTTDGAYGRSAFVGDFLSFMAGRRTGTPYDPLLADA